MPAIIRNPGNRPSIHPKQRALRMPERPNILLIMTDQQRFDTIASLGNASIYTPNFDRLVRRGVAFSNAYSTCPVCIPARYTIMSGCEPTRTGVWKNMIFPDMHTAIEQQCGKYLPEVLRSRGYRTFGVGKFHTFPWDSDLGFDVQYHSEEIYFNPAQRDRDSYASFIAEKYPEYAWIEGLMGERADMYYMPQMSPLPAWLTVEAWAADRAVECIQAGGAKPWFGFISFVGPHPPFAPPQPFNRLYNPDLMPSPYRGDPAIDHRDQQIPLMNRLIWADDISDSHARSLKARYYGEITYLDSCLGRILDCVDAASDADNTLICFCSDHGEHLGDHAAWQKESYFESSSRVPLLVSWPARIPVGLSDELVCLTDFFALATAAAGTPELRQGEDLLGVLSNTRPGRKHLVGCYGLPGQQEFKIMVRKDSWKLIYLANGGETLLFDLRADPLETRELSEAHPEIVEALSALGAAELALQGCDAALEGDRLRAMPYQSWRDQLESPPLRDRFPSGRIQQFDFSRGIFRFPQGPAEIAQQLAAASGPGIDSSRPRSGSPYPGSGRSAVEPL
jgi:arylsulfatase